MKTQIQYTEDEKRLLLEAANEFVNLKTRRIDPQGKFDKGGRFYLDNEHDCCRGIRSPSRQFPYSQLVHGRTANHVACEYGVDAALIKKIARFMVV
jgi:hypothetical protein